MPSRVGAAHRTSDLRRISVAPGTETTDREVPVDPHAPHVVGDSASEAFDASCPFTPLPECLPSHWPHHPLHSSQDHALSTQMKCFDLNELLVPGAGRLPGIISDFKMMVYPILLNSHG